MRKLNTHSIALGLILTLAGAAPGDPPRSAAILSSTNRATTAPAAKTPPIRHSEGRFYIDGLQGVNWGGSFLNREDSQVACLVAALRCAGQDVTYSDVMGLSGCAFKITLTPKIDIHPMHSEFGLDWPEIMGRVFGMKYNSMALDLNAKKTPPEKVLEMVKDSVGRGLPVFFMNGEWWLVVGYREDAGALLSVPYAGLKPQEDYRECPVAGGAWFAATIQKGADAQDRTASVQDSLRTAVRLATTPSIDNGKMLCGFAAYEAWIKALREKPDELSKHGNAFSYSQLLTSRKAAAEYLQDESGLFEGKTAQHVRQAGERYRDIAALLTSGATTVSWPWDQSFTPENRETEARTLTDCLAQEREAVAHLQAALDEMSAAARK